VVALLVVHADASAAVRRHGGCCMLG
jgi:hypothetical protein